jgi:glycosyltransferase involved in cell wall biosynthesis
MKIALAHHSLNIPGGAERLCLTVIEALQQKGHTVSLVTVEKTDWRIVEKNFGRISLPAYEVYLTENRFSRDLASIRVSSTYFLAYILQLLVMKIRGKYNLTINTFGDVVDSIADITYVHFPLRAAVRFSQIPAFSEKSSWYLVAPFYEVATKMLDKINPGELLTNSKFMQGVIKEILCRRSLVVYPPVDTETFASRYSKDQKSEPTVVVVASYTPKRHLEQVPLIAEHATNAKFVVMGKADEYSPIILQRLRGTIHRLHVEDRVELLTNVPFAEFANVLSKAKVYLHVMPYDHFGISVVEAMASGCVPVVHRSGGPWLDILDGQQGKYGFSYTSPKEAAESIDALVTDEDLRSKLVSKALIRAKEFDKAVFKRKIVEVVEKIAS